MINLRVIYENIQIDVNELGPVCFGKDNKTVQNGKIGAPTSFMFIAFGRRWKKYNKRNVYSKKKNEWTNLTNTTKNANNSNNHDNNIIFWTDEIHSPGDLTSSYMWYKFRKMSDRGK